MTNLVPMFILNMMNVIFYLIAKYFYNLVISVKYSIIIYKNVVKTYNGRG